MTLKTAGASIVASDGWRLAGGQQRRAANEVWCPEQPTTTNYPQALENGALRVRVAYPGVEQPLYGVLAFCQIPDDYTGPASRLYLLEIPQSYVDATSEGRVSVVFEPYTHGYDERWAWALWLSQVPFPGEAR